MGAMIDWLLGNNPPPEKRMISFVEAGEKPGTDPFIKLFGLSGVSLPTVNVDSALSVPAVWAAVTFLSRSLAALPLHSYRNTPKGSVKIAGGIQTLIHEAPNREWTSFKLRQFFWQQVFTGGRGLIWIERSGSNIIGLWPMDPTYTRITRDGLGRTTYELNGKSYPASDVIDVPFMLKSDGLSHYGPIERGAKAIQLALAMNEYGSKFFAGGGVPPLAVEGPLPAGKEAMARALADINRSIEAARENDKPLFPMPPGYKLTQVGFDPDKGQMEGGRRFQVEEIARVYNIPPMFLQDLTRANFSNSEQQDLHLVKHLIGQWAKALEQEMNLKLFGQRNGGRYIEHNLDGLLRGDFKARMEGLGQAVQNAILTPNEARGLENRPMIDGADGLLAHSGMVPLDKAGEQPDNNTPDPQGDNEGQEMPDDGGVNDA